ncbi:hypothetical protein EG349_19990 (plasmid) [Chryseobacterium shandongense]|jgi:hypothetical protein|uniref:Uncharacterized protein n=1 Tax=Chryseobacterium shandongense TaxID=1493872 RepID=A0AAD0YJR6_9FLAO|nr:hypothetical protein [Chryseobacterium shandongense]AZA89108.1 hypothetical protein EG349_19990 [Chryseobacterium shandongense]AZA98044.1 hypothetical protein EG353_20875 [Chryseobacterium shandongense]
MLPIDIFKIINSDEYNNLNNYLISIENFLNIELKKISDNQEKLTGVQENVENNNYSNEIELFNERRYYYGTVFTSNFRITLLSLIISSLENILKDICYQYKIIKYSSFDINDLKGNSDIEKAKAYLTKVSNKNIGKIPKWSEINDYKFIRNKFTHQNGRVSSKSSDVAQLRAISAKYQGIKLFEKNDEIRIWISDKIFCKNALNDSYIFISNLIDALRDDQ